MLLTSELVSRAVEQCESAPGEEVELRAWMPADVVRVELRRRESYSTCRRTPTAAPDDLLLLDQVSRPLVDRGGRGGHPRAGGMHVV